MDKKLYHLITFPFQSEKFVINIQKEKLAKVEALVAKINFIKLVKGSANIQPVANLNLYLCIMFVIAFMIKTANCQPYNDQLSEKSASLVEVSEA